MSYPGPHAEPVHRVYTLPVLVGGGRQNLSLQVDTGSADLVRSFISLTSFHSLVLI